MTTRPDHHEPLDAEERDLAARLGRVGPFEGPSPALDAKILAAAHAAAVTRAPNRRRHFAWLGVPPALVTGVGVAAAAVLALGLVWQMRPQYGDFAPRGEADSEEEVILIAEPAATASAPVANPPPFPTPSAPPAPAERSSATARMQDSVAAPASAKATASVPAPAPEAAASDEAGLLAAQPVAPAEEKRAADASAASANDGFVAEPADTAAQVRKSHATYTTAARAESERRERASRSAPAAAAAPSPPAAAAAPAPAASESDAATLDRIEVTGSRVRNAATAWSEVPVSDDSRLAADEWLQRIRARRDDGDLEHARASLRLFQRQHPRVRLPADLRKLLTDGKQ